MFSFDFTLIKFELFLLILTRISMFVVVAPFFNTPNTPVRAKIGFAALVSLLLYFVLPVQVPEYSTVVGYAFLVVKEAITGVLIGFSTYICNFIIGFAGQIIDLNIGLSMAQEYDPTTRSTVAITGNLYNYFILLLLIVSDMHRFILKSLCDAYEVIPVGGPVFPWDSLLTSLLKYMSELFIIGFRIALPVFAVIMILDCVLGIMVKVAPQIHMFSVGVQMKVIIGFFVLFVTVFLLPSIAEFIFNEMRTMMVSFIEGMY